MGAASGQDGYFRRVEERGWMWKKLTIKMINFVPYFSGLVLDK